MPDSRWVKSSFSDAGGNNCVEVASAQEGDVALRESEDPDRVVVASRRAMAAMLTTVKTANLR